jgi:hypothetical protein
MKGMKLRLSGRFISENIRLISNKFGMWGGFSKRCWANLILIRIGPIIYVEP